MFQIVFFILTSNFSDEKDIVRTLGFPIYSRIDTKVEFKQLTDTELRSVINKIFSNIYKKISREQVELIKINGLQDQYLNSVEIFKNIRLLDKYIENDIFNILFDNELLESSEE